MCGCGCAVVWMISYDADVESRCVRCDDYKSVMIWMMFNDVNAECGCDAVLGYIVFLWLQCSN